MWCVLTFSDGHQEATECPLGQTPDDVREQRGARLVDACESMTEAKWKIASNPNGKASSI
jgi:hypothetical protein